MDDDSTNDDIRGMDDDVDDVDDVDDEIPYICNEFKSSVCQRNVESQSSTPPLRSYGEGTLALCSL